MGLGTSGNGHHVMPVCAREWRRERKRGGGIEGEKAKIKGREEGGTENDKKVNEREEEEEWGEERERVID